MRRIVSPFFATLLLLLVSASIGAFGLSQTEEYPRIVATTSWTAAFALAAGAENVHVLAPYEMRHPPEYELAPSDIAILTNAEFVIFAGYEGVVPRIKEAIGSDGPQLVQIATDFSAETIESSVLKVAILIGNENFARRSIDEISAFFSDWRDELKLQGLAGAPVVSHAFHRPLAVRLGAEVVGVYGPAPLEARQIVTLSSLSPRLILDNYHNDVGKPLRETMIGSASRQDGGGESSAVRKAVAVVEFINFPGAAGTVTLMDVLRENRRRLQELME